MDFIKVPMAKPVFGDSESKSLSNVVDSGWLGQGKITKKFEKNLSKFFKNYVTVVNNGSSAIMCALLSHNVKPGDKVIVPNFTFISTASVPKILGCEIIPVDIDPSTLNIDLIKLEKIVKQRKINFVIFVDVAGLVNDIKRLEKLSKNYNFTLIEDAAEAFGSEYNNNKIGSFSHTTIFSFHIAKLITTVEGGCLTTKNSKLDKKMKSIRDLGRTKKGYVHQYLGTNLRITDLQSSLGIEQLKKIKTFLKKRKEIASLYTKNITGLEFQSIPEYSTLHSHMLFFAFAPNEKLRNIYVKELRKKGIDTRMPWMPIHMQPCFPNLNKLKFKNSEYIYKTIFTLPMHNSLSKKDTLMIIKLCNDIAKKYQF